MNHDGKMLCFETECVRRAGLALCKANVGPEVRIKAAGGIRTLQDAEDFINLGADRLGTSAIVKLVKGQTPQGY